MTDGRRRTEAESRPDDRVVAHRVDPVTIVVRRVLPLAIGCAVMASLVRRASGRVSNPDTYFHLRLGEEFRSGRWEIADPGQISTFGTAAWVPTQWLPEVVMAQAYDWFGLPAVAWLAGLMFLGYLFVTWRVCRRRADLLVTAVVTTLVIMGSNPGLSMRPQVISFALVVVTSAAWLRARDQTSTPWLLIPLTWVWSMSHGMWILGVIVGLAAAVAICVDERPPGRRFVHLLSVPVLSLVAALLTPVGPRLLGAVASVGGRGEYFSEWAVPSPTAVSSMATLLLVGMTVLTMVKATVPTRWLDVTVTALALAFAIYSIRTVPVAAALVAPFAAARLQGVIGDSTPAPTWERLANFALPVVALIALAFTVPQTAAEPRDEPAWYDSSLGALPAGTKVYSGAATGSHLMWRFPDLDLVSHGYGDMFTTAELDRNRTIRSVEAGWDDELRRTAAEVAVLETDSPLAYALELADWAVLEESDGLTLLEAPGAWLDEG